MLTPISNHMMPTHRTVADNYYYGEGVEQNLTEALKWYLIAAESGDEIAQSFVSICLESLGIQEENINRLNTSDWFKQVSVC